MNKKKTIYIIAIAAFLLCCNSFLMVGGTPSFKQDTPNQIHMTTAAVDTYPYKGILKVYVVEPESRWIMHDNNPYHYGFLDYAVNEEIELNYNEEYSVNTIWNPSTTEFSDVQEDNLIVIAAVFNQNVQQKYAYPPFNNPFNAHLVDAAAGARPGETDHNTVSENYTHTVLVEEGTATWCPYCPAMANALHSVYSSGEYPFYFIAYVTDENPLAVERMAEMNLAAYPSSFFDGGNKLVVGGYDSERTYTTKIESSGRRDVHSLDLSLSVDWTSSDTLEIAVSIRNTEEIISNGPPAVPAISGNTIAEFGTDQQYEIRARDPEGNTVYYMIDWGDGTTSDWLGPYASNTEIIQHHIWDVKGTYNIQVKAKDIYNQESEWGSLEVSMPKQKMINYPFVEWLLAQFPLLEQLFF